jgi:hypothetical protein
MSDILAALPAHIAEWLASEAEADARAKGCRVDVAGTLGEILEHVMSEGDALAGMEPASRLVH